MVIVGANVHDTKLLAAKLDTIAIERLQPTSERPHHLYLDKAYDNPTGAEALAAHGYRPHIRRIGEEILALSHIPARSAAATSDSAAAA